MRTIHDIDLNGKVALVRVDFNVPLDDDHSVTDPTRILRAVPTIEAIRAAGGAVVLMSHLGRPKQPLHSVEMGSDERFSLRHVVPVLEQALKTDVRFAPDCVGEAAFRQRDELGAGGVLLLENLRFYADEKTGEEDFAELLSQMGHVYVNDAFGTAHRAHASTAVIARYFAPEARVAGLLMAAEVQNAHRVLRQAEEPFTAILGGAKVSDKIDIIRNLLTPADHILIGGGMAYTFVKARGGRIGTSLVEDDKLDLARDLLHAAGEQGVTIHLPVDSIIADGFANDASTRIAPSDAIDDGWMGLDIGPKARASFSEVIRASRTVLWNGPMGVFEMTNFQAGTRAIGEAVAAATDAGAFSLVGGGDSVAAVNAFDLADRISYVSTGGGAMLEFFEGKVLPGVAALEGDA